MADEVYSRFEKTKQDGTKVNLKIQDMQMCDQERLVDFMQKWFIDEEILFQASGIGRSEEAKEEMRTIYKELFKSKLSVPLVCYVDDESLEEMEIIGCNALYPKTKERTIPPVQSEELKTLFKLSKAMHDEFNLLSRLNVELSLSGAGLAVDPGYRGCGIATKLLKARKPMMAARGVQVTSAWFTALASQKAAEKAGYVEMAAVTFEELTRRTGVVFTVAPKYAKLLVLQA